MVYILGLFLKCMYTCTHKTYMHVLGRAAHELRLSNILLYFNAILRLYHFNQCEIKGNIICERKDMPV